MQAMTDHTNPSGGPLGAPLAGSRRLLWFSWLLGGATLAGVVGIALHLSDAEDLAHLLREV